MGIPDLYSLISPYFVPYKLQNNVLLVDGGLCLRICGRADDDPRLGNDYDLIYNAARLFFHRFRSYDVKLAVIMDGRFDETKKATIEKRLQSSLKSLIDYNKNKYKFYSKNRAFPMFKTNVFLDVCNKLDIFFKRCDFEADGELIEFAKVLKCPLVSHDSDFALCDGVTFIPYDSISDRSFTNDGYILCKRFNRGAFLADYDLDASHLPLLGVIFDSDRWEQNVFGSLFPGKNYYDISSKVRHISIWLRNKTVDSAIEEIANVISQRDDKEIKTVKEEIRRITDMYGAGSSTTLIDYIMQNDFLKNRLSNSQYGFTINENDMTSDPYNVPLEVLNLVRECRIPCITLDMHNFHTFLCRPHSFEDINKPSIHQPSERLIRGIYGILTRNLNPRPLLSVRMRVGRVMEEHDVEALSFDALSLPNGELNDAQRRAILREIVFPHENLNLRNFDDDWYIFTLALIYIKKECGEEFRENYIHSILLTALILQTIKKNGNLNDIEIDVDFSNALIPSDYLRALTFKGVRKITNEARLFRKNRKPLLNDISHIHMYLSFGASLEYLTQIFELLKLPGCVHFQDFIAGSFFHHIVEKLDSLNDWRIFVTNISNNDRDFIRAYEIIVVRLQGILF